MPSPPNSSSHPTTHHGIDALRCWTRLASLSDSDTKLDLAHGYHHQVRIRESDWWKTSFRPTIGKFAWKIMPFVLQGASSVLMRVMNSAMSKDLHLSSRWPSQEPAGHPDNFPGGKWVMI